MHDATLNITHARPCTSASPQVRTWAVAPELYPCEPSAEAMAQVKKAVKLAVAAWGERQLNDLEAEDRLSVACEKGITEDEVTLALREGYQVGGDELAGAAAGAGAGAAAGVGVVTAGSCVWCGRVHDGGKQCLPVCCMPACHMGSESVGEISPVAHQLVYATHITRGATRCAPAILLAGGAPAHRYIDLLSASLLARPGCCSAPPQCTVPPQRFVTHHQHTACMSSHSRSQCSALKATSPHHHIIT
jgi:hypothetical protein